MGEPTRPVSPRQNQRKSYLCPICGKEKRPNELLQGTLVHGPVVQVIQRSHPDWSASDVICLACLNRFRAQYVEDVLVTETGELSQLERDVVQSLREQELLSADLNREFDSQLTAGERLADRIADFGGSWTFILIFFFSCSLWMALNTLAMFGHPFDPYPFILLNLVLSTLAAIQAPVIITSQNRQEAKDRLRAEHDYRVNLKAELEIRHLHAKLDQLLSHQWRHLLEIQQMQMEFMEELARKPGREPAG